LEFVGYINAPPRSEHPLAPSLSLTKQLSIERPVVDRLGHVVHFNLFTRFQILEVLIAE
jgi:hypothetical protein